MPRGTQISERRIAKEKLTRMLEFKSLFSINDMVSYFGKSDSLPDTINEETVLSNSIRKNRDEYFRRLKSPNFALIKSSNHDEFFGEDNEDDDVLTSILSSVESRLKKRQSKEVFRKQKRDLDFDQDQKLNSLELEWDQIDTIDRIGHSNKISIPDCEPILSGILFF